MNQIYAALVFLYKDGKVLAIKRNEQKGYGLPGGKINQDECPEFAAIRECFEETGLVVSVYVPSAYAGLDEEGHIVKTFRGEIVTSGIPLTSDEGEPVWISPEELIQGSFWKEYNEATLRHFGLELECNT